MVIHSTPTSEVSGSNPKPYVGKMDSFLLMAGQFTVQNLDQLYILVSSTYKTTHRNMIYTVLKVMLNPQINK